MIIKVKGKLKWYEENHSIVFPEGLRLKIVFKLPNEIFPKRLSKLLTSSRQDDFWEMNFHYLENKESVIEVAKSMIVDHLEEKYKETCHSKNKKRMYELLKDHKFEIEFEYIRDDKTDETR